MGSDGIYSGVLTSYPARGRYTFSLRVRGTEYTRVPEIGAVARPGAVGGQTARHAKLRPTGEFLRTARGPVIRLRRLPAVLPPGKITDFTVSLADTAGGEQEAGRLTTSWTSAGGDFSSGPVVGYRFVYSTSVADLLAADGQPTALLSLDKHQTAGARTTQELYFPHYDTDYYMAVVPVDADGLRGPLSNLVHVYVPAPAAAVEAAASAASINEGAAGGDGPAFNILNSEKDWIMVGVICGILLVLIVISVVSISYFCCVSSSSAKRTSGGGGKTSSSSSRKPSTSASLSDVHVASSGSSDHTDGTDAGSFDSDMKNLSAGHIMAPYDAEYGGVGYNGVSGGGRHAEVETPTKESMTVGGGGGSVIGGGSGVSHLIGGNHSSNSTRGTPVYWSASQLLSKLEEEGTVGSGYSPQEGRAASSGYSPQPDYYYSSSQHHHLHPPRLEVVPDYLDQSRAAALASNNIIPDEFCVTVSNLTNKYNNNNNNSGLVNTSRDTTSSLHLASELGHRHSHRAGSGVRTSSAADKMPPPLYPKPKNITQV